MSDDMRLNAIQTQYISSSQLIPESSDDPHHDSKLLDFSLKNDAKGVQDQQDRLEEIEMGVSPEEIVKIREKLLLEKKNFTILETIHKM